MKKFNYILLLLLGVLIYACQEELPSLGDLPDASTVKFSVVQDLVADPGGNTVILINETPEAVAIWDYGTGKSNRDRDTIRFAFKGEYTIHYAALTGGGVVEKDPVIITVTADNLSYVDDPLWTALTGGVGNEKTWYLDLDAEGKSKYFMGPVYFSGNGLAWGGSCVADNQDLCWIWEADWAGNSWIGDAGDYGSMTFSLKGGPFVQVDHKFTTTRGLENGTFYLDADNHTLTMTGAAPLQNSFAGNDVKDWNNFRLISLTEDVMQIGAFHGSKEELLILNFISKEYNDAWQPPVKGDPNIQIDLGGGLVDDVLAVTKTKTWSMSPETPFDWASLEGSLLNGWQKISDYPDWAGFNTSFQSEVSQNKIQFGADGSVVLKYPDGTEAEGSYEVNSTTNTVKFTGVTPNFKMGTWAVATTTDQNEWRIVKTKLTGSTVTELWFGKRDPVKAEYMVFHFVLGSSDVDPSEAARKEIISALTGPEGSRKFRVSDSWHVDWLGVDLTGGWTSATTFGDDFNSNSWVWTQAVKDALQAPRLIFFVNNGKLWCTRDQNGESTTVEVTVVAAENALIIDMPLIAFSDAASWLPNFGPKWTFCKVPISSIQTDGMWLSVPSPGKETTEAVAIHYVIAND